MHFALESTPRIPGAAGFYAAANDAGSIRGDDDVAGNGLKQW